MSIRLYLRAMKCFLVGYMASGKSTIGEKLASELGFEFIDLDNYISSKVGMPLADFIRIKGELAFRKMEKSSLEEMFALDENVIVSCGGGTPVYYNNMDEMLRHGRVIYLDASIALLKERLLAVRNTRPLLDGVADEDLSEFIAKHLFERRPVYERAHVKVQASQPIEKIIQSIINELNQ